MNPTESQRPIGFLTVVHVPELGHCGGFLLVNGLGRPVEFHCTTPVRENRTQQILYGQTYLPFLFCDQIGRSVVSRTKLTCELVIINQPELLPMRESLTAPLVLMSDSQPSAMAETNSPVDSLNVGAHTLTWTGDDAFPSADDWAHCLELARTIPLDEPFERIQQAIDEAQAVIR